MACSVVLLVLATAPGANHQRRGLARIHVNAHEEGLPPVQLASCYEPPSVVIRVPPRNPRPFCSERLPQYT
jgi:hypothetical protein